jgi:hypothetical protein
VQEPPQENVALAVASARVQQVRKDVGKDVLVGPDVPEDIELLSQEEICTPCRGTSNAKLQLNGLGQPFKRAA